MRYTPGQFGVIGMRAGPGRGTQGVLQSRRPSTKNRDHGAEEGSLCATRLVQMLSQDECPVLDLDGPQLWPPLRSMVEGPIPNVRLSHGFYQLDGCSQASEAEGEPHLPQVSIVEALVEAFARHAAHFIVQVRPLPLLAGAVEYESYDLGIEFHVDQNYIPPNQTKAKRLRAIDWLCGV